MSSEIHELIVLTMRYVLTGLMVLIVLRAAYGTWKDSRRASTLRRLSPMTGLSGELVVLDGSGKARPGMHYPVIREGLIGSSRRADVRIRHASVRRRHAYFRVTDEGLMVRTHAGAKLCDGDGAPVKQITLRDGDSLLIGSVLVLVVLGVDSEPRRRLRRRKSEPEAEIYDDVPAEAPDEAADSVPDELFDMDSMDRPG